MVDCMDPPVQGAALQPDTAPPLARAGQKRPAVAPLPTTDDESGIESGADDLPATPRVPGKAAAPPVLPAPDSNTEVEAQVKSSAPLPALVSTSVPEPVSSVSTPALQPEPEEDEPSPAPHPEAKTEVSVQPVQKTVVDTAPVPAPAPTPPTQGINVTVLCADLMTAMAPVSAGKGDDFTIVFKHDTAVVTCSMHTNVVAFTAEIPLKGSSVPPGAQVSVRVGLKSAQGLGMLRTIGDGILNLISTDMECLHVVTGASSSETSMSIPLLETSDVFSVWRLNTNRPLASVPVPAARIIATMSLAAACECQVLRMSVLRGCEGACVDVAAMTSGPLTSGGFGMSAQTEADDNSQQGPQVVRVPAAYLRLEGLTETAVPAQMCNVTEFGYIAPDPPAKLSGYVAQLRNTMASDLQCKDEEAEPGQETEPVEAQPFEPAELKGCTILCDTADGDGVVPSPDQCNALPVLCTGAITIALLRAFENMLRNATQVMVRIFGSMTIMTMTIEGVHVTAVIGHTSDL